MSIRLYPLPSLFDEDIATVRSATPVTVSSFYLRRPHFVPWSANETTFVLETDEPSAPHEIIVNRSTRTVIVPGVEFLSINLQLAKGANRIDISTPTQDYYITVASTAIETWLHAIGREMYLSMTKRMRDVRDHFLSPWTTRVSAHLLPMGDLFLPSRMPKIQQTRLAMTAIMGGRMGFGDGVRTMASALSYSTPWVSQNRDSEFTVPGRDHIYAGVTTFPTTGETQGRLLDLWFPNQCLASKQALFALANNFSADDVPSPKPLRLVDVDDLQILLRSNDGDIEAHYINPLAQECADIEFDQACDAGVRAFGSLYTVIDIVMNSPQLPFDEVVENPLNFGFFDSGFYFDMSTGSGELGLGGDDIFDTVDPDDMFGNGFEGFSLSRRLDYACLDTRIQRGQRMVKYVPPIASTTSATPADRAAGIHIFIDGLAGAPSPLLGASTFWGTCARHYLYEGDWLRYEGPDSETQVVSAWPVFVGTDYIIKTTAAATYTPVGTQRIITAPAGFFEFRHQGMGVRIAGQLYSIVKVDTIAGTATVAGNPAAIPGGPFIMDVYEPMRDRHVTDGAPYAGNRTFEITVAAPFPRNYADLDPLDYRPAPRVVGSYLAGVDVVQVSIDIVVLPGDKVYLSPTTFLEVDVVVSLGTPHHTTGQATYNIRFTDVTPAPLADNQTLYAVTANPCFPNGDPVTPLSLISLSPAGYLTP